MTDAFVYSFVGNLGAWVSFSLLSRHFVFGFFNTSAVTDNFIA